MFNEFKNGPHDPNEQTSIENSPVARSGIWSERARTIQEKLAVMSRAVHEHMVEVGVLLEETQREQYWRGHYASFAEYVVEVVGISVRRAQELVKVIRTCRSVGVVPSEIARLGWSKLAVVVHDMTSENVTEILRDVEQRSYSQLKADVRKGKSAAGQRRSAKHPEKLILTDIIENALRLACIHTHNFALQSNLEFMAAKFLEHYPPPSRIPRPVMN